MSELNLHPEGDHIVQAIGLGGKVKMSAIRATETVREATRLHDLSPIASVALGRFMSGIQLMSTDLKHESDVISASIKSDGPLQGMTAVAKSTGTVKGFVNQPIVESLMNDKGKFDVSGAIGNGDLTIIRKQAGAKPYAGTVPLISGEIAEDLTYYLYQSEQIPTIVALGVLCDAEGVKHAGGIFIQTLPDGDDEETINYLEDRISGFPEISYLFEEGFDPAQILNLFIGEEIQYTNVKETKFECDCSREQMYSALVALSKDDLKELSEDENGIELVCEFCSSKYHFEQADMQKLYDERVEEEKAVGRNVNFFDL